MGLLIRPNESLEVDTAFFTSKWDVLRLGAERRLCERVKEEVAGCWTRAANNLFLTICTQSLVEKKSCHGPVVTSVTIEAADVGE